VRGWQAFMAVLALTACAELSEAPPAARVRVAPDLMLTLPSPAALGRRLDVAQFVVGRYGTTTYTFEARIAATSDRFRLVCVDSLGRKAMSIDWTTAGIATEKAPWVPAGLAPENILADIFMLYWPEIDVRAALAKAGAELAADAQGRSVRRGGTEIAHADFQASSASDRWNGWTAYRNLAWGYSLDIQSRVLAP
jgi:hypothetical protein